MKPAHALGEDRLPVDVSGLQLGRSFIAAVVEDHRGADALAAIAVDRRHVRTVDAVVFEMPVEWRDAHCTHALGDQVADRVVNHRRSDAGLQPEAIREIGRDVEFTAADVDVAVGGFPEGNDSGIETMDQCAEGQEVQGAVRTDVQAVFHWLW